MMAGCPTRHSSECGNAVGKLPCLPCRRPPLWIPAFAAQPMGDLPAAGAALSNAAFHPVNGCRRSSNSAVLSRSLPTMPSSRCRFRRVIIVHAKGKVRWQFPGAFRALRAWAGSAGRPGICGGSRRTIVRTGALTETSCRAPAQGEPGACSGTPGSASRRWSTFRRTVPPARGGPSLLPLCLRVCSPAQGS